jgi:hypothetical protein
MFIKDVQCYGQMFMLSKESWRSGIVMHTCNPGICEAETGKPQVQCQSVLNSETLSQKEKQRENPYGSPTVNGGKCLGREKRGGGSREGKEEKARWREIKIKMLMVFFCIEGCRLFHISFMHDYVCANMNDLPWLGIIFLIRKYFEMSL